MRILVAEDEKSLNRVITKQLKASGYSVDSCFNGEEAYDMISMTEYDAAVFDVMMPKTDGFTLLKKIRREGNELPVLFLTARDSIEDRVEGLDIGADDYLVKPFAFEELLARIRVLIRKNSVSKSNVICVGDLTVDISSRTVSRNGSIIQLSAKEYELLQYLAVNNGIVLSREKIEDHIWNYDYEGGTNVVDVYIRYLRKKIDDNYDVKLIHTVRGMGYVLRVEK
ncbi:MAG: response regulator transcription factor [Clostridia bacterium]|nr:response regulator transcription factor [Clostridia bacterium]MBQ7044835.1 response regulator transcription factor [Clostridia bacterium]